MFKKGFTLAEILVALSVVGIVAAISAPVLSNVLPDKDKIAVLKAYKSLNDATQELINDPGYYINNSDSDGTCIGLACETQPIANSDAALNDQGAKYAHLLALYFNGENATHRGSGASQSMTFTTNDQVVWQVMKSGTDHFVSIDINGEDVGSKNCFYHKDTCKNPDRFQFKVTKEGFVSGYDVLTTQYLKTRYNVKNRKNDLDAVKNSSNPNTLKPWVAKSSS